MSSKNRDFFFPVVIQNANNFLVFIHEFQVHFSAALPVRILEIQFVEQACR
jgi:hypothetical protein